MESMEEKIIDLVAADRAFIPVSSFAGKLDRKRPKIAKSLDLGEAKRYDGERVFAYIDESDTLKARTLKGVDKFKEDHPEEGKILEEYIQAERRKHEVNLCFGMVEGRSLTGTDYVNVMMDLGLSQHSAERFYPILMEITRNLQSKRKKSGSDMRSILIG